jgi:hypothetical protein
MSYIGNTNTTQAFTPAVDFFSGNASTTAFTLSRPVASVAQVQVNISNVPQNPGSAYTVSGNTITFTSAPPSGTNNIYVYYTSPITQVIAPGQGTVTSESFGAIVNFTTTGNTVLGDASTDTLNVGNGGLVKDASGNVGIGTASPAANLHVSSSGNTEVLSATTGANYTTFRLKNSTNDYSMQIRTDQSNAWVLRDETAGANRLVVDTSGNVGIGTASPSTYSILTAYGSSASGFAGVTAINGAGSSGFGGIQMGSDGTYVKAAIALKRETANGAGSIVFYNDSNSDAANWASTDEKMRIDINGNVGIGTSSPVAKLGIVGGTSNASSLATAYSLAAFNITPKSTSGYSLQFGSGPSDVPYIQMSAGGSAAGNMTIQPYGGNVLIGTTAINTISPRLTILGMTAGNQWSCGPTSGNDSFFIYNQSSVGVYLGYGNTSWSSSSDERIKTAITPFENALDKVCTLRAGTGRYLTDEETVSRSFLIAQDVQAVLPEAVNVQDDEIGTLGLQYTDVIPLLVAAIKEQQAIITALTERITALENT